MAESRTDRAIRITEKPIADFYIEFSRKRAIEALNRKLCVMEVVPEHLLALLTEIKKHREALGITIERGPSKPEKTKPEKTRSI